MWKKLLLWALERLVIPKLLMPIFEKKEGEIDSFFFDLGAKISKVGKKICKKLGLSVRTWNNKIEPEIIERFDKLEEGLKSN